MAARFTSPEKTNSSSRGPRLGRGSDSWWWLATALGMAILLGLGAFRLIQVLKEIIFIVIIGIAIAAALDPFVRSLATRIPRVAAIVLIYAVLIFIFAGILGFVIPGFSNQVQQFSTQVPNIIDQVQGWVNRWNNLLNLSIGDLFSFISGSLGGLLLLFPISIVSAVALAILVFFVSVYGLIAVPTFTDFVCSLFPDEEFDRVRDVLSDMAQAMGGYVRGTTINAVIVGVLAYIGLLLIGVQYPLILAVITGLFEFIPVLGPILSAILAVLSSLLVSPGQALIVLVFYVAMQQFENHLLVPNIMQQQTNTSPLLVMLALAAGGVVGGLLGALAAIPLAAALKVLTVQVIAPWVRARTGAPPRETAENKAEQEV